MKKVLSLITLSLLISAVLMAQAPQGLNYQGIARTSTGAPIVSQPLNLRLTLLSGSSTGTIVYQEFQNPTTNAFGLYNVIIGTGTVVTGTFPAIDWSVSSMWMQVELLPTGSSTWDTLGISQLQSVPYAIYANTAGTASLAAYATSAGSASFAATAATLAGTVPMGGDLSGTNTVATVQKLQGNDVSAATPTSGQVLLWDGSSSQWTPTTFTGASGVTSIATSAPLTGGPITSTGTIGLSTVGTVGTYGSSTVVPVITTDAFGRVTTVTTASIPGSWSMVGDVTGTTSANTISALQGYPVVTSTPLSGDVLTYNGTDWVNSPAPGAVMGGDVTGTTAVNTISNLQGTPVVASAPATGDVLTFDGADWVNAPASGGGGLSGSPSYMVKFTSASTGGNSSFIDSSAGIFYNTTTYLNPTAQTMQFSGVTGPATSNWMSFEGNSNAFSYLTISDPSDFGPKGVILADDASLIDGFAGADNGVITLFNPYFSSVTSVPLSTYDIETDYFGTAYIGMSIDMTTGDVNFPGFVTKGAGTFKIDDPLDPENKYLSHSFVESPDMMNVYNGNITTDGSGTAVVTLPDYFQALNTDYRYQLTVIGGTFAQAIVSKEVADNKFEIKTSVPNVKVSWQVTGIRNDKYAQAHRVVPEWDKEPANKGKYLHPKEWGKPAEKGIYYADPSAISKNKAKAKQTSKPSNTK